MIVITPCEGCKWPFVLPLTYLVEVVALGINPYSRNVWLAENLTAMIPVAILVLMYLRNIRFSNTAYTLMAIFFLTHTIGGHYTFERVPIIPWQEFFGLERNYFDRGGDIGDIMSPPPGELPPGLAAVDADTDIDKALRMWHATAAKWSTG